MNNNPVVWLEEHIRQRNLVPADSPLMVTNIFNRSPTQLQEMNHHLSFLTPVPRGSKAINGKRKRGRKAINGEWKRARKNIVVHNANGDPIGIKNDYSFAWSRFAQPPKPSFLMTEYMRANNAGRAICIVQRLGEDNVQANAAEDGEDNAQVNAQEQANAAEDGDNNAQGNAQT